MSSRFQVSGFRFLAIGVLTLFGVSVLVSGPAAAQTSCKANPVTLQILGSGGPLGSGRASTGYLIWIDGIGRIMVDAGGGTLTRFHEAGGKVKDLELLAMTHFHADHATELPALLWLQESSPLLSGPTGSDSYPSATEYVDGLFGEKGVFRSVTGGKGLKTVTVDTKKSEPTEVFTKDSIRVRALRVPHGNVPSIGYRIDIGDASIAISSDQNGTDPAFVEFASGADILVVHLAIPEVAPDFATALHAKPSAWGQMAADANIGTLVLSHLLGVPPGTAEGELASFDEKLSLVRSNYDGPLLIAEDLMCIPVD